LTTIEHKKSHTCGQMWIAAYYADPIGFKEEILEARAGIEPAHKGFADLSLTTWVPRLGRAVF